MGVQKTAGLQAEDFRSKLNAYIWKKVKTNLFDAIKDVSPADRCRLLSLELDDDERTALHHAAIQGDGDVIDAILDSTTADQKYDLLQVRDAFGNSSTALAACHGHVSVLQRLLINKESSKSFAILNNQNIKGQPALHLAASVGKTSIIEVILNSTLSGEKRRLLMLQDSNGDTAIACAASNGHVDTVKFILKLTDPDSKYQMLQTSNKSGWTPLHKAAWKGHLVALKEMIASITTEQVRLLLMPQSNTATATVISLAAHNGHTDMVKYILDCVKDPNDIYKMLKKTNALGRSTAHNAALKGNTDVLSAITPNISKPDAYELLILQEKYGNTAIALAAKRGHESTVKFIANFVEDSSKRYEMLKLTNNRGLSTAHNAALGGHVDVFKAIRDSVSGEHLLDLLFEQQDRDGNTTIALLEKKGHLEKAELMRSFMTQCLSQLDEPTNQTDTEDHHNGENDERVKFEMLMNPKEYNLSVLHLAASIGKTSVIEAILDSTTPEQKLRLLMSQSCNGDTAIACAVSNGHVDSVKCIIKLTDPDSKYKMLQTSNNFGWTPLHKAARRGHLIMLKEMIASVTTEQVRLLLMPKSDTATATVISIAADNGHTDMVKYILDCVKDPNDIYKMLKKTNALGRSTAHNAALKGNTDVLLAINQYLSKPDAYELLMHQDSQGNIPIALAARRGHASTVKFIANFVEDPGKRYEMLKLTNTFGLSTSHIEALKGHVVALKAIRDSVSARLQFDLLFEQQDRDGNTPIALLEKKGQIEAKQIQDSMTQLLNWLNGSSNQTDRTDYDNREIYTSAERIVTEEKINELEAKTRETEVENETLKSANGSLKKQLEEKDGEIKKLTNQNDELAKMAAIQQRENTELKDLSSQTELNVEVEQLANQEAELKELTTKIKFLEEQNNKLTNQVIEYKRSTAETTDECTQTTGETNLQQIESSSKQTAATTYAEEDDSWSSDDEYIVMRSDLVQKLNRLCERHSVKDGRVFQHPYDWKDVAVIGTGAVQALADPLKQFLDDNKEEFKEFTVNAYEPNNEMLTNQLHDWQEALNFESKPESYARCELIVQAGENHPKFYMVGPAHMLFCEAANKKFRTEDCDIDEIRNLIRKDPPPRRMKVLCQHTTKEIDMESVPLIGYRYEYRQQPPPDKPHKLFTNDCVFYEISQERTKDLQRDLRDANPHRDLSLRCTNKDQLPGDHESRHRIAVQSFRGRLYNMDGIEDEINNCKGVHLYFVITSKNKDGRHEKLEPGDSGSIVYFVDKAQDGRLLYRPWGMLIGSGHIKGVPIYHAVVLNQVFKDIEDDYAPNIGEIKLLQLEEQGNVAAAGERRANSAGPVPCNSRRQQ